MRRFKIAPIALLVLLAIAAAFPALAADQTFKAGYAKIDITPEKPTPMWGYGARHDALSRGTRDPLYAKAIVIQAANEKIALVGLDLGRSPTDAMMERIRKAVNEQSGVGYLMLVGSHTHHGPVIELLDREGAGKGKFDDAVAYAVELERILIALINDAAKDLVDVKIGWGSKETTYNRNRHAKTEPKPVDRELAVIRLDDMDGKPFAIVVNFAAHPTILSAAQLEFSAEYCGHLMDAVEAEMNAPCIFMQGAAGDLSANRQDLDIEAFGKAIGAQVIEIANTINTAVPENPSIQGADDKFLFESRMDLENPVIQAMFAQAFFPELMAMLDEFQENKIPGQLTTILLNGQLALVGGSGEFFCEHSIRLKAQSPTEKTLFFGFCNGHHMYFPTVVGTEQGGYGADAQVSWVAVGAGEEMIDKAIANIENFTGKTAKR